MSSPAISPLLSVYERGTQAFILSGASSTNAQSGTAAPVGSNVFALAPSRANDLLPSNFSIQIDQITGTSGILVRVYGSLDGINFYAIDGGTGYNAFGINTIVDKPIRYITAAITTLTGGGTISVSFSA